MIDIRDRARNALTLLGIVMPVFPLTGPAVLNLEVCAKCNFSCLMCPFHSPQAPRPPNAQAGLIEMDLAERVIKSAKKLGTKTVIFGGRGEPLLHPQVAGIIRLAASNGMESRLFTNGSLLTPERIDGLLHSGLGTLAVSLAGPSSESYVKMHPSAPPQTFQRVLDSLALFQQLKRQAGMTRPSLDLRFIGFDRSYREVEKAVELAFQLAAESLHYNPLRYRFVSGTREMTPSDDDERTSIERLMELEPTLARKGLQVNLDEMAAYHRFGPTSHMLPCYVGWFDSPVMSDGAVKLCVACDVIVGSVKERPLEEIWQDPEYEKLRRLARSPQGRDKLGSCNCNRCCHFYTNWRINHRLSSVGLAPKLENPGSGYADTNAQENKTMVR